MYPFLVLQIVADLAESVLRTNVDRLLRAIEHAHLTEQQVCLEMQLSQSQWCSQKAGETHLSLTRLFLVPSVLRWYALLTLVEEGMPEEVVSAIPVVESVQKRRMARMGPAQRRQIA